MFCFSFCFLLNMYAVRRRINVYPCSPPVNENNSFGYFTILLLIFLYLYIFLIDLFICIFIFLYIKYI